MVMSGVESGCSLGSWARIPEVRTHQHFLTGQRLPLSPGAACFFDLTNLLERQLCLLVYSLNAKPRGCPGARSLNHLPGGCQQEAGTGGGAGTRTQALRSGLWAPYPRGQTTILMLSLDCKKFPSMWFSRSTHRAQPGGLTDTAGQVQ